MGTVSLQLVCLCVCACLPVFERKESEYMLQSIPRQVLKAHPAHPRYSSVLPVCQRGVIASVHPLVSICIPEADLQLHACQHDRLDAMAICTSAMRPRFFAANLTPQAGYTTDVLSYVWWHGGAHLLFCVVTLL